jgi:hypothetical protein
MASTVFVDSQTPVVAAWLNDVNNFVYGGASATRQEGTVTATSGQTIFTVPFTYTPGDKRLAVYINGIKQIITSSYAETNSTTVTFTEAVPVGAVVEFVY